MLEVNRHENIELHASSNIVKIDGLVGNFDVTIEKKARYTNNECNGCRACVEVCPSITATGNKFDNNTGPRKAIYVPFAQALPMVATLDLDNCILCNL